MRLLVSTSLILAWAMPALTATVVWQWIFDTQYGLVNWALDRQGESWLAEPLSFFMVATIIVVWMGIPFVAFTSTPASARSPSSIHRGGRDRRRRLRRPLPLRDRSRPLKPILLIITSLSILWDFRVFTQIYVLQRAGGITRDTNLLGVYAYTSRSVENRFDIGAAIAIVMVLITIAADAVVPALDAAPGRASGDARAPAPDAAGRPQRRRPRSSRLLALFPVYWMMLTSFRRGVDIQSPTPSFLPTNATLANYRQVFERDYFWTAMQEQPAGHRRSSSSLALLFAFLAAVALARFRFRGRTAFLAMVLIVQMIPAEALIISIFRVLDARDLLNPVIGRSLTYLVFVLPFTIWILRVVRRRCAGRARGSRHGRRRQSPDGVPQDHVPARRAGAGGDSGLFGAVIVVRGTSSSSLSSS